jgi:hypothetical protein
MILINYLLLIILSAFPAGRMIIPESEAARPDDAAIYHVTKVKKAPVINAKWNKKPWKSVKPIDIVHYMGKVSEFQPKVQAKMTYDDNNVYVIFQVQDRFVKSIVTEYNGPVSTDSCVEFFFSPDTGLPLHYFNLEINAGGTPLMFYIEKAMPNTKRLTPEELQQIEIAHSMPEVVNPEITDPVTWTIEYRVPISLLQKYSNVTKPATGTVWKANFYKTGSRTSNPNYITWSVVDFPRPNFHLPQFFGTLIFE